MPLTPNPDLLDCALGCTVTPGCNAASDPTAHRGPTPIAVLAQRGYDCGNACNATGVVYSLHDIMSRLLNEHQLGTDQVNRHPIVKVVLDKLCELAGLPIADDMGVAWREVVRLMDS